MPTLGSGSGIQNEDLQEFAIVFVHKARLRENGSLVAT